MSWMSRKSHINIAQIILDTICLILSYPLTVFITSELFHPVPAGEYLWIPVLFCMVFIFTMFTCEMYHRSTFTYQDRTLKYVIKSCIFAVVFCLVMIPFTSKDTISLNILMAYVLTVIIIVTIEYLTVQEIRIAHKSKWKKRAILVGCKENIWEYLYYIKKTSFHVELVGNIYLDNTKNDDEKSLGDISELDYILKSHVVDEIIFAVPCERIEDIRPNVIMCKEKGYIVRLAVDFFEGNGEKNSVHNVGTIPVFTYRNTSLNDIQAFFKRCVDILGSIIGLAFTAIVSVFLIPMLKIKLGGKVFTKKTYLSVNGRPFTLYRFNTEPHNSRQKGVLIKFLTRTYLSNLPVFWNVFKGDMSLVGGYPISAADSSPFSAEQLKNTKIRPGLTGLWRFKDKDRSLSVDYLAELNELYLSKWSFIRDIWLIFKTAVIILTTNTSNSETSLYACLNEEQAYEVGYSVSR